jgi:hypothetical protein
VAFPGADLRRADPAVAGGDYDALEGLYRHFYDAAPRGVGVAKIHKVLHVKRPAAYPILDSRIYATYRDAARRPAQRNRAREYKRVFWAALPDDLIANTESGAISALRARLDETGPWPQLTDLRLLDMVTWR